MCYIHFYFYGCLFAPFFLVAPSFVNGGITSPMDTSLNMSVAIFCHAMGFPPPNIAWEKNGVSLNRSNITMFTFAPRLVALENDTTDFVSKYYDGSVVELIEDNGLNPDMYNTMNNQSTVGVLLFEQVTRENNGNYRCIAYNQLPQTSVAKITSDVVSLRVLGES